MKTRGKTKRYSINYKKLYTYLIKNRLSNDYYNKEAVKEFKEKC